MANNHPMLCDERVNIRIQAYLLQSEHMVNDHFQFARRLQGCCGECGIVSMKEHPFFSLGELCFVLHLLRPCRSL